MTPTSAKLLALGILLAGFAAAEIPRAEHPRPDFRRDDWLNLNGTWEFRFDDEDRGLRDKWWRPSAAYDRKINVPFCWESKLSAVQEIKGRKIGWYRRQVTIPAAFRGKRIWLRFGAVDWLAHVWVNGKPAGQHEGGYTPFEFDITEAVEPGKPALVVVRALDGTNSELPVGKQAFWYTPTSGIWQTVWLEARPAGYIERLSLVPRSDGGEWSLEIAAHIRGAGAGVKFRASSPDATVEKREEAVTGAEVGTRLRVKQPKLWTPDTPHLYELVLQLESPGGAVDTVNSYFGLRTIARGRFGDAAHEYILLNGKPVYLRGALDQSFNPEGVYTAPSDEFLRCDMELARHFGWNFLRIHIKADEPRRLYWADRMGVMIMEDMPNTYKDTPHGRQAWEAVMRGAIERDRNHPSIISWCLFNETWGLGQLKQRPDVQEWVLSMWREAKRLDPTRLVEENSANKMDHLKTDINSFHFYLDNPPWARAWIDWVVRQTYPGSPFNYSPGYKQDGAPLINSEYGAISSSAGDRDVSWGFRYLTTQLRRHDKIQGYVYTELTDIEWEHNGLANYDRSLKVSGYDAFVPGMDSRDLQGADFIGFDAPPAIEARPGAEVAVPVFISHYSDIGATPEMRWWITGWDDAGHAIETRPASRPVTWRRYRATAQDPLRIRMPESHAFVGALAMELVAGGRRIAANYVNLVARPEGGETPRVQVLDSRRVALKLRTDQFIALAWRDADRTANFPGKFQAFESGAVEYRFAVPEFVCEAGLDRVEFMAEVASKARNEKIEWKSRQPDHTAPDYPQTDSKKHRGILHVEIAGQRVEPFDLPDDPADSRGVLSSLAGTHQGTFGFLMRRSVDLGSSPAAAAAIHKGQVSVRLHVPEGPLAKGLSVYGERMGQYPVDPTLIVYTQRVLKHPAGWTSSRPVAIVD